MFSGSHAIASTVTSIVMAQDANETTTYFLPNLQGSPIVRDHRRRAVALVTKIRAVWVSGRLGSTGNGCCSEPDWIYGPRRRQVVRPLARVYAGALLRPDHWQLSRRRPVGFQGVQTGVVQSLCVCIVQSSEVYRSRWAKPGLSVCL